MTTTSRGRHVHDSSCLFNIQMSIVKKFRITFDVSLIRNRNATLHVDESQRKDNKGNWQAGLSSVLDRLITRNDKNFNIGLYLLPQTHESRFAVNLQGYLVSFLIFPPVVHPFKYFTWYYFRCGDASFLIHDQVYVRCFLFLQMNPG